MRQLVFERLSSRHLLLVVWALCTRTAIVSLDVRRDRRGSPLVRALLARDRLQLVPFAPMKGCERWAVEQAARAPLSYGPRARTARSLQRLLGSPQAHLVVRRCLAERLSGAAFVDHFARQRMRDGDLFVPGALARAATAAGLDRGRWAARCLGDGRTPAALAASSRVIAALRFAIRQCMKAAVVSFPHPARRVPERVDARIVVGLHTGFLLKFAGPRRYDFLIDDQLVTADQTTFLLEVPAPPGFLAHERGRGRRILDASQMTGARQLWSLRLGGSWLVRSVCATLGTIGAAMADGVCGQAVEAAVYAHWRWSVLGMQIAGERYVYTNREAAGQIAANIVLRGLGFETWNYSLFVGGPYLLDTPDSAYDDRHHLWSFLNPDHWVVNCPAMRDSFAAHHQSVGAYHVVGNVFAQLIRGVHAEPAALWAQWGVAPPEGEPVVAIFDTSFVDDPLGETTFADGIAFYEDILAVARVMPNVRFLVKPSKDEAYYLDPSQPWSSPVLGGRLVELQHELQLLPNVVWAGHAADTTEVSALSEVTVTHCFSSPTADALAAGKKAIWYESGDRHRRYPMTVLPGAVIHGVADLQRRLDALLRDSQFAHEELSDTEAFRTLVDPYADGRGLDRFRRALAGQSQEMSV